jgi:two-component system sensor histidine kinase DesK
VVESSDLVEQSMGKRRAGTGMAAEQVPAERSSVWPPAPSARTEPRLYELVASSGISPRLWRLYAQAWLICLLFPILTLIQLLPPLSRLLLACAGLALFVACYSRVMWSHPLRGTPRERWPIRTAYALLAGLVVLVLILNLAYGSAFLWLLIGVSAMAGVLLPPRSAFVTVMALTLLTLGMSVSSAGGIGATDWLHVLPLILLVRGLGLDMAGVVRLASALREVHAARGELARMAVVEERLRMARDLHDLLGHTLAMITLKSELAARLVHQDPTQAAREMREVEQAARQTLREVRIAVAGERQPTLQGELDGAHQLLEAAGIAYTIEQSTSPLPVALDAALAWVVREGVTNVIRHSQARWCRVCITATPKCVSTEIANDGVRARGPNVASTPTSTGLTSLTERVAAQGGQLTAGPLPADNSSYRLCVELPIGNTGNAELEPRR